MRENATIKKKYTFLFQILTVLITLLVQVTDLPLLAHDRYVYAQETMGTFSHSYVGIASLQKLNELRIPEMFGQVTHSHKGITDKTVVIIQDLHCNYTAQKNIKKILSELKEGQLKNIPECIALEGARGPIDTALLKKIPDNSVKARIIDFLLSEGLIGGSEAFAGEKEDVALYGVEDENLYTSNVRYFKQAVTYRDEVGHIINNLEILLDKIAQHMFSRELYNLNIFFTKAQNSKNDFYSSYYKKAVLYNVDLREFGHFMGMYETELLEKRLSVEKVYRERQAVVDLLQQRLVKEEAVQLLLRSLKYRSGQLTSFGFYTYLENLMNDYEIPVGDYPHLETYIRILKLQEKISAEKIRGELREIEELCREKLYKDDEERILNSLVHYLQIYRDLFNLRLTRSDYAFFQRYRDEFSSGNFISFINKHQKEPLKDAESIFEEIEQLDVFLSTLESFYTLLIQRDNALIRNTLSAMGTEKVPLAVLVTGGFHTGGMTKILKELGISYFVVLPDGDIHQGDSLYFDRILGSNKILEALSPSGKRLAPLVSLPHAMSHEKEAQELRGAVSILWLASQIMELQVSEEDIEKIRELVLELREWSGIDAELVLEEKIFVKIDGQFYTIADLYRLAGQLEEKDIREDDVLEPSSFQEIEDTVTGDSGKTHFIVRDKEDNPHHFIATSEKNRDSNREDLKNITRLVITSPEDRSIFVSCEYSHEQKILRIIGLSEMGILTNTGVYSRLLAVLGSDCDQIQSRCANHETVFKLLKRLITYYPGRVKKYFKEKYWNMFADVETWAEFTRRNPREADYFRPQMYAIAGMVGEDAPELVAQTLLARTRGPGFVHELSSQYFTSYRIPEKYREENSRMRELFEKGSSDAAQAARMLLGKLSKRIVKKNKALILLRKEAEHILTHSSSKNKVQAWIHDHQETVMNVVKSLALAGLLLGITLLGFVFPVPVLVVGISFISVYLLLSKTTLSLPVRVVLASLGAAGVLWAGNVLKIDGFTTISIPSVFAQTAEPERAMLEDIRPIVDADYSIVTKGYFQRIKGNDQDRYIYRDACIPKIMTLMIEVMGGQEKVHEALVELRRKRARYRRISPARIQRINFTHVKTSPVFEEDARLITVAFQSSQNLGVDGQIGKNTALKLISLAREKNIPLERSQIVVKQIIDEESPLAALRKNEAGDRATRRHRPAKRERSERGGRSIKRDRDISPEEISVTFGADMRLRYDARSHDIATLHTGRIRVRPELSMWFIPEILEGSIRLRTLGSVNSGNAKMESSQEIELMLERACMNLTPWTWLSLVGGRCADPMSRPVSGRVYMDEDTPWDIVGLRISSHGEHVGAGFTAAVELYQRGAPDTVFFPMEVRVSGQWEHIEFSLVAEGMFSSGAQGVLLQGTRGSHTGYSTDEDGTVHGSTPYEFRNLRFLAQLGFLTELQHLPYIGGDFQYLMNFVEGVPGVEGLPQGYSVGLTFGHEDVDEQLDWAVSGFMFSAHPDVWPDIFMNSDLRTGTNSNGGGITGSFSPFRNVALSFDFFYVTSPDHADRWHIMLSLEGAMEHTWFPFRSREQNQASDEADIDDGEDDGEDMKTRNAPETDPLINDHLIQGDVIEISYNAAIDDLTAHSVRYVDGYHPGNDTDRIKSIGEPLSVHNLLSDETSQNIKTWLQKQHKLYNEDIRIRYILGETVISRSDEGVNIAHSGKRDMTIYLGEYMLEYLFSKGNEDDLKIVVEEDELEHLLDPEFKHKTSDSDYWERVERFEKIAGRLQYSKNIQLLETLCRIQSDLHGETIQEILGKLIRTIHRDGPGNERIQQILRDTLRTGTLEKIIVQFDLPEEVVLRKMFRQFFYDWIAESMSNTGSVHETGDDLLQRIDKWIQENGEEPQVKKQGKVLKRYSSLFLSDKKELERLIESLNAGTASTIIQTIGIVSAKSETGSSVVFIDISTLDKNTWTDVAAKLAESGKTALILVNHEAGKERKLEEWKRAFKQFKSIAGRLFTVSMTDGDSVNMRREIQPIIENLQNTVFKEKIPEENYVLFLREDHQKYYSWSTKALFALLSIPESRELSESEKSYLIAAGVKEEDLSGIEKLFEEIVVSTQYREELLEIQRRTEEKG